MDGVKPKVGDTVFQISHWRHQDRANRPIIRVSHKYATLNSGIKIPIGNMAKHGLIHSDSSHAFYRSEAIYEQVKETKSALRDLAAEISNLNFGSRVLPAEITLEKIQQARELLGLA